MKIIKWKKNIIYVLNSKEKELNNILNNNNYTEEEKDVNSIIMNYNNDNNYNEECKTINNQSNSSYTLLLKIKKEIKKFKAKISEEDEKIKKLKSSMVYTKLKEINTENDLIEIQIKKISSLIIEIWIKKCLIMFWLDNSSTNF